MSDPSRSRLTALLRAVAAVAFVASVSSTAASAQAVRPGVSAAHPSTDVAIAVGDWLSADRPRVAIHMPQAPTPDASGIRAARIRDAVTEWELLLLGLEIPYTVIDDATLERGIDGHIDVLIVPAAAYARRAPILAAGRYVREGGGLIAAGAPVNDPGARSALAELLGVRLESTPADVTGAFQVLDRVVGFPTGVPAGFNLNIAFREGFAATFVAETAARESTTRAAAPTLTSPSTFGRLRPYAGDYVADPEGGLAGLTALVASTAGMGFLVWTGFSPQDVSDAPDQQLAWQQFAVGALAAAGGRSRVSLDAWPDGRPAAMSVAVVPSPGYDPASMLNNLEGLLDMLERTSVPASFFIPGMEMAYFPGLTDRMASVGEFGVTTRSERPLHGQTVDVQRARISEGEDDVREAIGNSQPPRARGFLPPGLLHDGSTLRAVRDAEFDFMIVGAGRSLMPDSAAIHESVDFRDAASRDELATFQLASASGRGIEAAYRDAVRSGGLFVFPYRVEEIIPGGARYESFEQLIQSARRDGVVAMSLSAVSAWIEVRSNIRIEILEADGHGARLLIRNEGDQSAHNLVVRWMPGDHARPVSAEVSDPRIIAAVEFASGTVRLDLPEIPAGATLEFRIEHH
ncbi:MAG: polysaccharide deacetylase family protein [Rhodothermales bacterium]|nr:polysaccharide deacetylase family protein [Rhodothermales bacterium]